MTPQNTTDRAAEHLAASLSRGASDEREVSIIAQAASFGLMIGFLASYVFAALLAIAGQVVAPLVLLLVPAISTGAAIWFAGRRGVIIGALSSRVPARRQIPVFVALIGMASVTLIGILHTAINGRGIFNITVINEIPQQTDDVSFTWLGTAALIFTVATVLLSLIMMYIGRRRERRLEATEDF